MWATEAAEITRRVRVARALVKDSPNDVLLPVLNATGTEVQLCAGEPLDSLEQVDLLDSSQQGTTKADAHHVEHLWNGVNESVTVANKQELQELLTRYATMFSKGEGDLGRATAVMHKIDTGTALSLIHI